MPTRLTVPLRDLRRTGRQAPAVRPSSLRVPLSTLRAPRLTQDTGQREAYQTMQENAAGPFAQMGQIGKKVLSWGADPENLPASMAIAGGVGSATGGLGLIPAVGLTALMGAGGAGYRQLVRLLQGKSDQVPETAGGRVAEMATEGAKQGALELAGGAVTKALTKALPYAARTLYTHSLNPNESLLARMPGGARKQWENRWGLSDALIAK